MTVLGPDEGWTWVQDHPRWDLDNARVTMMRIGRVLRGSVKFDFFLNFFFFSENWKSKKKLLEDWISVVRVKVAVTVTALPDRQTRESPPEVVPVSVEGESSGTNPVPFRPGRSTEPKK